MSADEGIVVRECASLEEFRQCVTVQRAVWGFEDEDLIPARLFVVARKIEGQVLGAFEPSGPPEKMVGFALAVPALRGSQVYLHSHMLAVLPDYRERGVGQRLKFEQRRKALAQGIRWIEWTFDPLESKNAHFNLERLGAIARRYVPNIYGISSSPLHRGLPTDRLVAEWWLESPRAAACAEGRPRPAMEICRRIPIPLDIAEKRGREEETLEGVQRAVRRQFQEAFGEGLAAIGFEVSGTTGNYLLGRWATADEDARGAFRFANKG